MPLQYRQSSGLLRTGGEPWDLLAHSTPVFCRIEGSLRVEEIGKRLGDFSVTELYRLDQQDLWCLVRWVKRVN